MQSNGPIDTTKKLWEYYYRVRMPYMQTRTVQDIREKGTVVSGIPSYDRDIPNQLVVMMLTISQMADYFKEDVPIRVCSEADVKTIYEDISQHIHAWKARLERGINIGDAPVDDLILLDRFANSIYEHAKYQFTPEMAQSMFAQHLGSVQRINVSNFFNKPPAKFAAKPGEEDIVRINANPEPERDSLGEFFKASLINLRRR